jgi:leucyl aminopeptidase
MPKLEFAKQTAAAVAADLVAVFATQGDDGAVPSEDASALAGEVGVDLAAELKAVRFEGELGGVARIPTRGKAKASVVLVVGLGKPGTVTLESLRKAAGAAARNATKDATLAVVAPGDLLGDAAPDEVAQAVTEGAGLGAYAFTAYRSKNHDTPSLESIQILAGEGLSAGDVKTGVARGGVIVRAASLARDLVNEPPAGKRPPALADRIAEVAKGAGVKAKIWDEKDLAKGSCGGILGVGQGSSVPPRMVELTYDPARSKGHVVLVGKGITFDSGGLSLKPSNAMNTMKSDMSGAAAVVAAMTALKDLGVKTKVTGLVALAENMPSGTAIRVSDVLTHRNGKTVEVMNTDAEGRLVLADALAYGAEQSPDAMIDLATLTGAQVVALGNKISALMGTDDELVEALRTAGDAAGEQLWPLPLPEEYADHLKSEVADLKNIGKPGQAGTIVAGLFLKEFVGATPWAHLDIAGPAFTEEGDSFYTPRGATGAGVRTLLAYLEARNGPASGRVEAGAADDHAPVAQVGHLVVLVVAHRDRELQPPAVDAEEHGLGAHRRADRARQEMLELHPGADARLSLRQRVADGLDRRLLGQGEHLGCGQHPDVTRSHRQGRVVLGHRQAHARAPTGPAVLVLHSSSSPRFAAFDPRWQYGTCAAAARTRTAPPEPSAVVDHALPRRESECRSRCPVPSA